MLLDLVFANRNVVRILRALSCGPSQRWYTQEDIIYITNISRTAVSRGLMLLTSLGLVEKEGRGYFLSPSNPHTEAISALFWGEIADNKMGIHIRTFISEFTYKAHLELGSSLLTVALFGSFARNDDIPTSDIDLLVITETKNKATKAALDRIAEKAIGNLENRPSIHQFSRKEFSALIRGNDPLVQSLDREAITVYGSELRAAIKEGAFFTRSTRSEDGMMKDVVFILIKNGFDILSSQSSNIDYLVDIVARKNNRMLLVELKRRIDNRTIKKLESQINSMEGLVVICAEQLKTSVTVGVPVFCGKEGLRSFERYVQKEY
ncbi:MAG: nucleotidyltransferase domain-containing protein [Candidatus Undinarchaeales archaeon]|jgi:predicted nucleotidyltransferase|nr:nucleotidyltransferase domain-containing protein [Candidatus Undinarchaeales archaeon]MDP7492647.1 nucleotidyltransferase domain-containing protein [Candidatus Undinarchaeales archaeon]